MKRAISAIREKWQSFLATERAKTKDMTKKQKLAYFVTYYKLEAFCVLLIIGLIAFAVRSCIYLGKTCVAYLCVTDTYVTSENYDKFCDDFLKYIGDEDRHHYVTLDATVYSEGTIIPEDVYNTDTTYQTKSMLLLGSGIVDAYVCTDDYVQYLLVNEDIATVEETLGAETARKYAGRLAYDGRAIILGDDWNDTYFDLRYKPAYLVFTYNNHFPEVTKALARFLLEK